MTHAEVEAVVSKVKYRSWRFRVDDSGDIVIAAPATCAYSRKRKRLTVYGHVTSPEELADEAKLLVEIREAISCILHHEMSEWFKYKGKRIFDAGH